MNQAIKTVPRPLKYGTHEGGPSEPEEEKMKECGECEGTGYTAAMNRFSEIVADLTYDHTPGIEPLLTGLCGRSGDRMLGHDARDRWIIEDKIIKAAGLPEGWGRCETCHGTGLVPDDDDRTAEEMAQDIGDAEYHRRKEDGK